MLEFVCPECGDRELLEVREGCSATLSLCYIDKDGDTDYRPDPDIDGGRKRWRCAKCGWRVPGVNTVLELVAWLQGGP